MQDAGARRCPDRACLFRVAERRWLKKINKKQWRLKCDRPVYGNCDSKGNDNQNWNDDDRDNGDDDQDGNDICKFSC